MSETARMMERPEHTAMLRAETGCVVLRPAPHPIVLAGAKFALRLRNA